MMSSSSSRRQDVDVLAFVPCLMIIVPVPESAAFILGRTQDRISSSSTATRVLDSIAYLWNTLVVLFTKMPFLDNGSDSASSALQISAIGQLSLLLANLLTWSNHLAANNDSDEGDASSSLRANQQQLHHDVLLHILSSSSGLLSSIYTLLSYVVTHLQQQLATSESRDGFVPSSLTLYQGLLGMLTFVEALSFEGSGMAHTQHICMIVYSSCLVFFFEEESVKFVASSGIMETAVLFFQFLARNSSVDTARAGVPRSTRTQLLYLRSSLLNRLARTFSYLISASASLVSVTGATDSNDYSTYFTRILVTNNNNDFRNHNDTVPLLVVVLQQTLQQQQQDSDQHYLKEANTELVESLMLLISHLSDNSMPIDDDVNFNHSLTIITSVSLFSLTVLCFLQRTADG